MSICPSRVVFAMGSRQAQQGGIARVGRKLARLPHVLNLPAQPFREPSQGAAVDEELHSCETFTASMRSLAITACAYAMQARMSAGSSSG